jgi:uncharacterized membrane protein YhaH (DUF805 family)
MNLADTVDSIIKFITNVDFLANLLLLTFVALYAVFSLVLALQVKRLTQTVTQKRFSPIFQFLAILHAIAAILLIFIVAALI